MPAIKRRLLRHRRGSALISITAALTALLGVASLAVDIGHVWVVKAQLQNAADAAARYGLEGLADSWQTAQSNAITAAADNTADGATVNLNPSDIEFGTWNKGSNTFTVLTGSARASANAMRVTARRTAAAGNGVKLFWGGILGQSFCSAHATVVGTVSSGYGLVGLTGITLSGNSSISYWPATGATSPHGSIASNGPITLSGNSSIQGDVRPGIGYTVSMSGTASVTGTTQPLTTPLSYPNGSAGPYASSNDNANLVSPWLNTTSRDLGINGSANPTYPGGNYYVNNVSVSGNSGLAFSGPTTLYLTGNLNISGALVTSGNLPRNLRIVMLGSGNVQIGNNAAIYTSIYAPQSAITLSGSGDIYGSVLGLSINMTGTSGIHYDLSLLGGWNISIVQ